MAISYLSLVLPFSIVVEECNTWDDYNRRKQIGRNHSSMEMIGIWQRGASMRTSSLYRASVARDVIRCPGA